MATRKKTPAAAHVALVPADREQAAHRVREMGDVQRRLQARVHQLDCAIAALQAAAAPEVTALSEMVDAYHEAIKTWAEGNRARLTDGHRIKTVNLITGDFGWRNRPPSVSVTNTDVTVRELREQGLSRYVREKAEVNKDAILATHSAVAGLDHLDTGEGAERVRLDLLGLAAIKGIRVNSGLEDFFVAPYETEVSA